MKDFITVKCAELETTVLKSDIENLPIDSVFEVDFDSKKLLFGYRETLQDPNRKSLICVSAKDSNGQMLLQYLEKPLEVVYSNQKTFNNTTAKQAKDQVKDIEFWGDGDTFKLISKASSKSEEWMKSTKAMAIPGKGVLVQVSTQQGKNVAEALQMIDGACIVEYNDENGKVVARSIVADEMFHPRNVTIRANWIGTIITAPWNQV